MDRRYVRENVLCSVAVLSVGIANLFEWIQYRPADNKLIKLAQARFPIAERVVQRKY